MAETHGDVLVVDNDQAVRRLLTSILQRAGYSALGVASAEEAQTAIADRRPDVVLTEVQLPGVSGYELCRLLKEEYGDRLAVIIVSGNRTEAFDRTAGILLGADDYMVKPVDPGELVARVWRLAGRSTPRRAPRTNGTSEGFAALSRREREVLDLLAAGSDQDEIAQALFISPKTVATHIQRILTKLDVRSRAQAVAVALGDPRS